MKKRQKLMTDEQWDRIGPLFPEPKRGKDGRGRPQAPNRNCLEGILWILQTGAAWRFLPDEYPSPSTCWRRLKLWEEQGVWLKAWRTLLGALDEDGPAAMGRGLPGRQLRACQKGATQSARPSVVKAQSGWYWETVKVFRWEFGWRVPRRQKLRLRTPRSSNPRPAAQGSAAAETEASDRRPWLRLRPAARTMEKAGH